MTDAFRIGQTVALVEDRIATIRYIGSTSFADGDWIGVELENPIGKNDGSVQGKRYFECPTGHGIFIRPGVVLQVLEEPTPKPDPTTALKRSSGRRIVIARTSSGFTATSSSASTDSQRQRINAGSPTPGAREISAHSDNLSTTATSSKGLANDGSSREPSPTFSARSNSSRGNVSSTPSILARNLSNASRAFATINGQSTSSTILTVQPISHMVQPPSHDQPAMLRHHRGLSHTSNTTSADQEGDKISWDEEIRSTRSDVSKPILPSHPHSGLSVSSRDDDDSVIAGAYGGNMLNHNEVQTTQVGHASAPHHVEIVEQTTVTHAELRGTSMGPPPPKRPTEARKVDDLENKLRLLEKKRAEDREKLKSLERLRKERDHFESVIHKLQTKFQPQQQEMISLRRQVQESQINLSKLEAVQGEHDAALEMATLDREMAEETAESLRTELATLKSRAAELEEEVKVLREENEEYGKDISAAERTSQGWLQMERSNERLQEALIRLRDITHSQELALRKQVASLQDDLKNFDGIEQQYNIVKEKLQHSENAIQELQQQLDATSSAEEMVEELSENNLRLSEQVESLKASVQDLEDLGELNNELERGRLETERQLQEEINYKDGLLGDVERRLAQQEERLGDQDYTIGKFRELTIRLQNHIDDLKSSQKLTEAEVHELNNQSRAMASFNLKLQESIFKSQGKSIDEKMQAMGIQQTLEHLKIMELFLSEGYVVQKASVLTYLCSKRLVSKCHVLHWYLQEVIDGSGRNSLTEGLNNSIAVAQRLINIATLCDWIVYDISGCLSEAFSQYGMNLQDLESVERTLDQCIVSWKKDELKLSSIVDELQCFVPMLSHIVELHNMNSIQSRASTTILRASRTQEQIASVLRIFEAFNIFMKGLASPTLEEDNETFAAMISCAKSMEGIILSIRGSKYTAEKAIHALEKLRKCDMAVQQDDMDIFHEIEALTSNLLMAALELLEALQPIYEVSEVEILSAVTSLISLLDNLHLPSLPASQTVSALVAFTAHLSVVSTKLNKILSISTSARNAVEFTRLPPPWTLQATSVEAKVPLLPPAISEELAHLRASLQARLADLHNRDRILEEQTLKIELLETRMRDATLKAAQIERLEKSLELTGNREKELAAEIEALKLELQRTKLERDELKAAAAQSNEDVQGNGDTLQTTTSAREVQGLKLEIKDLQSAIRHLRQRNSRTRYSKSEMSWLSEPLLVKPTIKMKADKSAAEAMEKEALALFGGLRDLVARAEIVDVSRVAVPQERLKWRPVNEKSAWVVARQREEWELWKGHGEAFVVSAKAKGF